MTCSGKNKIPKIDYNLEKVIIIINFADYEFEYAYIYIHVYIIVFLALHLTSVDFFINIKYIYNLGITSKMTNLKLKLVRNFQSIYLTIKTVH